MNTEKIENKIYKLEDKKYSLEIKQGDIQEKIERFESKNKNTKKLEDKFEVICFKIEKIENTINELESQYIKTL
jgi:hypothetical protein